KHPSSQLSSLYQLSSPRRRRRMNPSTPDVLGKLDDHAELRPLFLLRQHVALLGRGEATLRRAAILIELRELRGLLYAWLDIGLLLERAALRGDQPEHHHLRALRQEPHRLEAAGTIGVVFEEIAVEVHRTQEPLRHRLVAPF